MAAARPPPPVYLLNQYLLVGNSHAGEGGEGWARRNVHVGRGNLTGKAEEGWSNIEIARRDAYGCGNNMREALNGLSLCVRRGDGPLVSSTLGIRISRDARERFISEAGIRDCWDDDDACERPPWMEQDDGMPSFVHILKQEQDLWIMSMWFMRTWWNLGYFLVYDRSDASLSMVSVVPESPNIATIFRPVPNRTSDGAFKLFLLATVEFEDDPHRLVSDTDSPPFLCVFSPVTAGTNRSFAWEERRELRWNVPVSVFERFNEDATFSFQGKPFWADLSHALIYCDMPTTAGDDALIYCDMPTTAGDDDSAMDFRCIELPGECQLDEEETTFGGRYTPMKLTRTIACVGDSIWFVCILRGKDHADDSVTMWTLELPGGQWKNEARFPVRELWRFDGFKEEGLPEQEVGYPFLTADGALGLVLIGPFSGYSPCSDDYRVDHICTFDVRNKRLLWHGIVHDHMFTDTVAFPPDFFLPIKHPYNSHKRKVDELCPAAGPGIAAMANGSTIIWARKSLVTTDRHQGKSRTSSAGSRFFVARLLLLLSFVLILARDV